MGWFTKWQEERGLVVDLSGEMEGASARFAVVDVDSGRRVKVRLRGEDATRLARGDRIRFVYAPDKRTKAAKEVEVLERSGGGPPGGA